MALIQCEICGADEWNGPCTKCDHVKDVFAKLKTELHDRERKLDRIREAGLFLLSELTKEIPDPQHPPQIINVSSQKVLELWDALELRWYNLETVQSFLSKELIEGQLQIDAFDVFRKDKNLLSKLTELHQSCQEVLKFHGWKDTLEKSPKDLISE